MATVLWMVTTKVNNWFLTVVKEEQLVKKLTLNKSRKNKS